MEALEDRTLLSLDLSIAFFLPVEPGEIALAGDMALLESATVDATKSPGLDVTALPMPEIPPPALGDPQPAEGPLSLTLISDSPVTEGSTAQVAFVFGAEVPAEVLAGLTFSYDFNHDGVFEIENSELAAVEVPAEFLPDGPATVEVLARVTDAKGNATDYLTTIEVQNVAPTLDVETQEEIAQDGAVTLDLGVQDPGMDQIQNWIIDWGDGTQEIVPGDTSTVTHTFPEGSTGATIQVRAADDDGAYQAPALQVTVNAPPRPADNIPGQSGFVTSPLLTSVRDATPVAVAGSANLAAAALTPSPTIFPSANLLQAQATQPFELIVTATETRALSTSQATATASSGTNATGVLSGRVFDDANRNGRADAGEAGAADREVVLEQFVNGSWQVVRRTRTDAHGGYSFNGLVVGRYLVRPLLASDQELTGAFRDGRSVAIAAAGDSVQVDFGIGRKAAPLPQPEARLPHLPEGLRKRELVEAVLENWAAEGLNPGILPEELVRQLSTPAAPVSAEVHALVFQQSSSTPEQETAESATSPALASAVGIAAGLSLAVQAAQPAQAEPQQEAPPRRGWFGRLWSRLFGRS